MKSAPLHYEEQERLQKLLEYEILDTETEQVFDDLTLLASEICGTPISLITLIDHDRQWFKSKVGTEVSETEREIAFCSHAILQDHVFEVEDALRDERFHDNPLVAGNPDIRFYAGMPLKTPEGLPLGTLCVIDQKPNKLTPQQKRSLEILSREVIGQLELRVKTKRLEKANQFKTDFLSNMSHEIRTPLNAIIGFSEVILADPEKYLNHPMAQQYLEHIDFSGKHLLSMINAVLDLSKIEAGKMELSPVTFDLCDTIDNLSQILQVTAEKAGVTLVNHYASDASYEVWLDVGKLSQIIINIVNNAIKFSDNGSSVNINTKINKGALSIEVIDEGVGISKTDLKKVFDKYQQVGKKSGAGTGLGLSITMGLVELMGGDIVMKSKLGKGTTVTIKIPLPPLSYRNTDATKTDDLHILPGLQVLVVEDNKINQLLVKSMLEKFECEVTVVDDGNSAIHIGTSRDFDLILMDINLPDISGIEAAKQISKQVQSPNIVALTADIFAASNNPFFSTGLTKPITLNELKQTLAAINKTRH